MERLIEEISKVKYSIEGAKKTKDYTFTLENEQVKKYILSKYDPKKEMENKFKISKENKGTIWVIFGFGFGYQLNKLFEECGKDAQVIVVEPNPELLEKQIQSIDCVQYNDKPNLVYFSGAEFDEFKAVLLNRINISNVNNISVIEHSSYTEFYTRYYKKIVQSIAELRARHIVNNNTVKQIQSAHIKNVIRNSEYINQSYHFQEHKDKYKGTPAVIISAGPSLSSNVEFIKDFKGLIFTVGRTLPVVKQYGANADFTALIDWHDMIQDTFKGEEQTQVPLISLSMANSNVIENAKGPLYFIDQNGLAKRMLEKNLEELSIAGSVATLCLSAAYYMGCDPIIFIGQDLAYTGMKGYANECNIFSQSVEEAYQRNRSNYQEVNGYDGNMVLSDYALISFLRWIEEFIKKNNDRTYINATEGGARIEGTLQKTFEEVVAKYKDITKPLIRHIKKEEEKVNIQENLRNTYEKLKNSKLLAEKATYLSQRLEDEYTKYNGIRSNKITKLLHELDRCDEKLMEAKNNALFDYVFQGKYNEIMMDKKYQEPIEETEIEKGIRLSQKSYKLYHSLYQAVEEVCIVMQKELEMI